MGISKPRRSRRGSRKPRSARRAGSRRPRHSRKPSRKASRRHSREPSRRHSREPSRRHSRKRNVSRSSRKSSRHSKKSSRHSKKSSRKSSRHSKKSSRTRAHFGFSQTQHVASTNQYTLYELKGCSACDRAIGMLAKAGITPIVKDSSTHPQEVKLNGKVHDTWPKVYYGSKFIGGSDKLEEHLKHRG
jgi:glutaredoxin